MHHGFCPLKLRLHHQAFARDALEINIEFYQLSVVYVGFLVCCTQRTSCSMQRHQDLDQLFDLCEFWTKIS